MNEASVGHQCPECVAEGRRTQRPARTAFGGSQAGTRGYVTTTLIVINVGFMLVSIVLAGGQGMFGGGFGGLLGGGTPLTEWGAVQGQLPWGNGRVVVGYTPYGIAEGEVYRLFTAMFLHYGILHLFMNMWALWILGRSLEADLGPIRFLALYLVSGLGGSVAAYLFSPAAATAGASGAIFGTFAALFIVFRRLGRDTSSVIPILILNLAISFVPGISLAGHLGGFVTGGIIALALSYAPRKHRTAVVVTTVVGLVLLMAMLVVMKTAAIQATPLPPGIFT
jgi:membrane associated rhomboid family serine protease